MIVGGGGVVSTPLISTAVGVVEPARAGMASGINSTLRQVQGLNTILLISAIVAFTAAAVSFALIRELDFVTGEEDEEQAELAVAA